MFVTNLSSKTSQRKKPTTSSFIFIFYVKESELREKMWEPQQRQKQSVFVLQLVKITFIYNNLFICYTLCIIVVWSGTDYIHLHCSSEGISSILQTNMFKAKCKKTEISLFTCCQLLEGFKDSHYHASSCLNVTLRSQNKGQWGTQVIK